MAGQAPIAVALDAPDLETAARWAALVTPHVSTVKVGLELYLRYGPDAVASVRGASGVQVFLDLKLHDIPATVAGAARAVARLRPALLTVHAAAGPAAIRAAADAAPGTQGRGGHRADLAGRGRSRAGSGWPGRSVTQPAGWRRSPSRRALAGWCAHRRRSRRCGPRSATTSC